MTAFLQPCGHTRLRGWYDGALYNLGSDGGVSPGGTPSHALMIYLRVGETQRVYHPLIPKGQAVSTWTSDGTIAVLADTIITAVGTGRCTVALETGGLRAILYVHVVPTTPYFLVCRGNYEQEWNTGEFLEYQGRIAPRDVFYPEEWSDESMYFLNMYWEYTPELDRRGLLLGVSRAGPDIGGLYTFTITNDNEINGSGDPNVSLLALGITAGNATSLCTLLMSVASLDWSTSQQQVLVPQSVSVSALSIVFAGVDLSPTQALLDTTLWQESSVLVQLRVPAWDVVHVYSTDAGDL